MIKSITVNMADLSLEGICSLSIIFLCLLNPGKPGGITIAIDLRMMMNAVIECYNLSAGGQLGKGNLKDYRNLKAQLVVVATAVVLMVPMFLVMFIKATMMMMLLLMMMMMWKMSSLLLMMMINLNVQHRDHL